MGTRGIPFADSLCHDSPHVPARGAIRGSRAMQKSRTRPPLGGAVYFGLALALGTYFTFAAIQGNHGVFQRVEIEADIAMLRATRDRLAADLALIENLTRRLSDDYLDLDLLDQQAREVLGMARADDLVIR